MSSLRDLSLPPHEDSMVSLSTVATDSSEEPMAPDCPPEPVRWFHSVDSPLFKPNEPKKPPGAPPTVRKPPTTWVAFNTRDSNALERTYAAHPELHHHNHHQHYQSEKDGLLHPTEESEDLLNRERARSRRSSHNPDTDAPAVPPVLVNEDYLFEVDIRRMEIKPVYWLGATYEVRRAIWFLQTDGKFLPCELNLTHQIEYGYRKHRPWIAPTLPTVDSSTGKDTVPEDQPEKNWALLGKYISQYVVFEDAHHAWLLSDDLTSKVAKSIFTKVTGNGNVVGTRLIRGYDEVEKFLSKKASEEAALKKGGTVSLDKETKKKETSEFQKKKETAQQLKQKTKKLTEQEKDEIQEAQEIDDYAHDETEERQLDHLILVIHGVGQKLGDKLEAINFIHDVNVMRRTIKETARTINPPGAPPMQSSLSSSGTLTPTPSQLYGGGRDGPLGAGEKDKGTTRRRASTASKNPYTAPSCSGVQVLPVEWRRQIVFGMATDNDDDLQVDLSTNEAEEACPTMDDIMLEAVPTIRMLLTDVIMDILLYMTPNYKQKMLEVVTAELNYVYRKFITNNPDFIRRGGKVSIIGHSLGSLLTLDILNHQPFERNQVMPIPSSPVFEKFISFAKDEPNPVALDFKVTNFFALGSPIALFLLLKGCRLGARLTDSSKTQESTLIPCVRPAVENMFNIYHNSDPVASRMEPLISRNFAVKHKPVLIPYHKGGLKGLHLGIQDFSTDLANRANTMLESVKLGISTAAFTRALGFRTNPVVNAQAIHASKLANEAMAVSGTAAAVGAIGSAETELGTMSISGGSGGNNGSSTPTAKGGESDGDGSSTSPKAGNSAGTGTSTPTLTAAQQSAMNELMYKAKVKALNKNGRVDYVLQEGILENAYLTAISVHMQYWSDSDVAAFIIRQTYDLDAK